LFSGDLLWRSLVSGVAALVFCVVLYFAALQSMSENRARALTFFGLVVMNLQLILFSRVTTDSLIHSLRERNRVLWWIIGVTLLATFLALEVPAIADVFHFEVPAASALASTFCAAIVVMFGLDWMLRRGTRVEPARRPIT
jgi:Ca2+-transporting ATPase